MRSIFIMLSILLLNRAVYAQSGLELTATVTPTYSTILNPEDQYHSENSYRASFGFVGQATAGYNFTEIVGLAMGFGISYQSQSYIKTATKDMLKAFQETSSRSFSYFRVPLLFRVGTNPDNKNSFFARFGPHMDILLSAIGQVQYPVDYNQRDEYINYNVN